ncbi:MAG: hypothetical protein MZW92_13595 [Comamonadaceae bacterium]|nr:hypothetical protein [Comamonadaceae bacterium]
MFYEAPHRVADTVSDLAALLEPSRTLVVARELTKLFESIEAMPLGEAAAWLAADENRRRGEFVLIVSGARRRREAATAMPNGSCACCCAELPLKQAVKLAAEITGAHRNALYRQALDLKQ